MSRENEIKVEKTNSLYYKFFRMFSFVLLMAALTTGLVAYFTQDRIYKRQYAEELRNLNNLVLEKVLERGDDFVWLQDWFGDHKEELKIPFNYPDNAKELQKTFANSFAQRYPGLTFGTDITVDELDPDMQLLYARYLFLDWLTTFDKVRDEFGLVYAYYVYPTPGREHDYMCYMFDAPREEEIVDGQSLLVVGFDALQDRKMHKYMWQAYETGKDPGAMDIYSNEYGHVLTYSTPVIYNDKVLGVFMTDIGYVFVEGQIWRSTILLSGLTLLVLGLCFAFVLVFVRRRILVRLSGLEGNVEKYAADKDPAIAGVIREGITIPDEIGSLSSGFSDMIERLQEYMTELKTVTAEKERIGAELNIAKEIQASMLPKLFPRFSGKSEYDMFALMDPAKEVGGDFYDFFMVDDRHLAMVIADVAGKGIPGALYMAIAKALIKDRAQESRGNPALILGNAGDQLCEGNDTNLFVTVWIGILDLTNGHVIYADAGHENPVLIHEDGNTVLIKPQKKRLPLAAFEGIKYLNSEFDMQPGDTLLLYTDGVPEATDNNEELYGMDRLLEICRKSCQCRAEELVGQIRKDVDLFVKDAEQFDDMTMLALKLKSFKEVG